MYRGIAGILLLTLALCGNTTAQNGNVCNRLVKRYGHAYAWGKSYIVRVNNWYAFADSTGHIVGSFSYRKVDTALPDRAIACKDDNGKACLLMNEYGQMVNEGSAGPLRLTNRKKRIFAMEIGSGELLINDMGRQLTYQGTEAGADANTIVQIGQYGSGTGLMTLGGDTLLPTIYSSVSIGSKLYCGFRNDTAYVFQHGKGLLFRLGKVHSCEVLSNDFIVAKKYGAYALVSKKGKLLTEFKYEKIETLRYPHAMMPGGRIGSTAIPQVVKQYARISAGQPEGLIDSNGREVLPMAYDNLIMNTNGWFVLRKVMHDNEILTDNKLNKVLEAKAYDITFTSDRYASVNTDRNYHDPKLVKTYDMVLRKYVNKPAESPKYRVTDSPARYIPEPRSIITEYFNKDSMIINEAGTKLLHRGGLWGVISQTGDTILPFVYDSAGVYGWHSYYVGSKGRFGKLNYEGELAMPVELPELPMTIQNADSVVFSSSQEPYNFKGGHIRKMDAITERVNSPWFEIPYGGMTMGGGTKNYKYGLYNRQMKFLADRTYGDVQRTGIVAITDSAKKNITIIDSTGKRLTPWILIGLNFKMYEFGAVFVNDTGKPDLLCRIDSGVVRIDTVWLEKKWKTSWWRSGEPDDVRFEKPGYGKGLINRRSNKVFFMAGTEDIRSEGYQTRVMRNGKWQIYDDKGKLVLPTEYDSLGKDRHSDLLYKNGKVGIYSIQNRLLIQPEYDSIGEEGTLGAGFLIAYKEGKAFFIKDSGKIFSSGWENVRGVSYSMVASIPATRNGIRYRLYPTLSDSIKGIPDTEIPDDIQPIRSDMDGTMIAMKGNNVGVYDVIEKKWLVPAAYNRVEKEEDYFAAYNTDPESVTMYTSEGKKMFTLKGSYSPQREFQYDQWHMRGWNSTPVVNDAGKVIVPETFDYVSELAFAGGHFYIVRTKGGKVGIIDTSGKVIASAIYDEIFESIVVFGGYFIAAKGGKICLMSPEGGQVTACKYNRIFSGYARDERRRGAGCSSRSVPIYEPDTADMRPYFIASLEYDSKFGVINGGGKELVPCVYDSIKQVHLGKIAVVKQNGKWGVVNLTGKPVTEFKYDRIEFFYQGEAHFERGNMVGRLRDDGTEEIFNR